MKIITKKEFLEFPEGTVFSKYTPCNFGDLRIKGESIGSIDFYYQPINSAIKCNDTGEFVDNCTKAEKESIEMDFNCQTRDGLFGDNQLFAVWEEKDLKLFIKKLERCLYPIKKCTVIPTWADIVFCRNCGELSILGSNHICSPAHHISDSYA